MTPRVSAIVPSYNHARFVRRAVESALAQRGIDHEVIVLDDASTDATPAILRELGARPGLRIELGERNRGISATFNRGLEQACGEFVAFLGSDDWWLPDHLAGAVRHLERTGCALVYGRVRRVDAEDRGIEDDGLFRSVPDGEFFEALLLGRNFVPFVSAVMRREVALAVGGFDETLVTLQDYDLWLRIAARHDVSYRDVLAGAFRWSGDNASYPTPENSARFRLESAQILEKALREIPEIIRERGRLGAVRRKLAAHYRRLGHRLAGNEDRARCYGNSLRLQPFQIETACRYVAVRLRAAAG